MSADPQRTRARIEQAAFAADEVLAKAADDTDYRAPIGYAAAREALQMVKERLRADRHAALLNVRPTTKGLDYAYITEKHERFVDELLADLASDEAGKET